MATPLPDPGYVRHARASETERNGVDGRSARPLSLGRNVSPAPPPGPSAADDRSSSNAVTVAEALRVVLPGSRVAGGGAAGLSRRVTWATSLRSRPPAFEPRGGGEFVLASRDALAGLRQSDQSMSLARILGGLAQAGAAALACPAPMPPDAVGAANTLGLPLVELPAGASVLEFERGIISLVLNRHNELQARASQFYRQLAQLTVESRGLDAIFDEAARTTGLIVVFEDQLFRLRAVTTPEDHPLPPVDDAGLSSVDERGRLTAALQAQPSSSATPPAIVLPAVRWRMERTAAPVVTRERLRGFVSLCGAQVATEFDQLAVSRLAAVCALELAKEDAVLAAEQRVQGDLIDELLRPYGDAEASARHAAQAGFTRHGAYAVFLFEAEPAADADLSDSVVESLSRYFRRAAQPALVKRDGAEVIAICQLPSAVKAVPPPAPGPGGESQVPSEEHRLDAFLRGAAPQVFSAAAEVADGARVTAGVSRVHLGLAALPAAAREAREALRIGGRVYGTGRLTPYADLGLYRVLHSLRDTPELGSFYEQTLGPLVEYDRRTGQNLIETLEAFFACHGNLSQTAQRLQLHRNSLLYRISRIQEIGGVDLEDPETRLSLQVALKARRLLS